MPKYQIKATIETDEVLDDHDLRCIADEVRESAISWDAGSAVRIKTISSDIPIVIKRVDGKHADTDDAFIVT